MFRQIQKIEEVDKNLQTSGEIPKNVNQKYRP